MINVDFLQEASIEQEAEHLLKSYEAKYGKVQGFHIPVEEIAELHLGYSFEIVDLTKMFGGVEVNGLIDFDSNTIKVDKSLEPTENPNYIGKYNSTIAHECGHDVLHKSQLLAQNNQEDIFQTPEPTRILCKKSDAKESIEWQADNFAHYLTMPKQKMYELWKHLYGDYNPKAKMEFEMQFRQETIDMYKENELVEIALKNIARKKVGVSARALRIRFEKLGLIDCDLRQPIWC